MPLNINECGKKIYFCQDQGVLNFCTGVNLLLMKVQKFKTPQNLAIKMLFRDRAHQWICFNPPIKEDLPLKIRNLSKKRNPVPISFVY
jgi:hypothetical protein